MRYVDEFRNGELAGRLGERIAAEVQAGRDYRLMEFCGGHTHAISCYGLTDLLPPGVHMIHGPGCPVCVLPAGRIDQAIELYALNLPTKLRDLNGEARTAALSAVDYLIKAAGFLYGDDYASHLRQSKEQQLKSSRPAA